VLEQLRGLSAPVFAVTGNWDEWSRADAAQLAEFCARSGGRLLNDESTQLAGRDVTICGAEGKAMDWLPEPNGKLVLLVHYPQYVENLRSRRFDLILAGHSHGGQVRLPFIGALIVPRGTGRYKYGLYDTPAGALYVTSGVGSGIVPFRLNCRPEIAVIEL
jgi:predicted MPP superfamily phosphohydrolase